MQIKKRYFIPLLALLVVGIALGMKIESVVSGTDTYEQLKKLEDAYLIINQRYVDDVEPNTLVQEAILGMLTSLDPHSSYISAEQIKEVQEGYRGSFGGIGIWFEVPRLEEGSTENDTARVTSTISGGPSEDAGVMAGDRILAVDGTSVVGSSSLDIQNELKGPIGTDVTMTVKRLGLADPIDIDLVRDRIPLISVDNTYMVDDETGYLRVSRFAMTTYDEFMTSVTSLKEQGMERLILDLRGNQGGIMESAVRMSDEMLPGGETIVYTKSRNAQYNTLERSSRGGLLDDQSIIVLVNEYSASASEIVAGALQDHDRALIVGNRTFGKGLVQNQFQLEDGSVMQMTVSRYYTPSGRLIQTPYVEGEREDYYESKWESLNDSTFTMDTYAASIADSLKYKTTHGRTVFGGGGILPDVMVKRDLPEIVGAINSRGLTVRYVREWFVQNEQEIRSEWDDRKQDYIASYQVSETEWQDFTTYLTTTENGLTLTTDPEAVSAEDGVFLEGSLAEHRDMISTLLKGYKGRQIFGTEALIPIINPVDPVFVEAMQLWEQAGTLAAYHTEGETSNLGDAGNED